MVSVRLRLRASSRGPGRLPRVGDALDSGVAHGFASRVFASSGSCLSCFLSLV